MTHLIMAIAAILSYSKPAEVPVRVDFTVKGQREGFKRRWPMK
jgi:hypothetical protein